MKKFCKKKAQIKKTQAEAGMEMVKLNDKDDVELFKKTIDPNSPIGKRKYIK